MKPNKKRLHIIHRHKHLIQTSDKEKPHRKRKERPARKPLFPLPQNRTFRVSSQHTFQKYSQSYQGNPENRKDNQINYASIDEVKI